MALIKQHAMQARRHRNTIAAHHIGRPGTRYPRRRWPAIQVTGKAVPRLIHQQIDGVIINIHRQSFANCLRRCSHAAAAPSFLQANRIGADRIIYLARQRARCAPPEHERKT